MRFRAAVEKQLVAETRGENPLGRDAPLVLLFPIAVTSDMIFL